MEFYISPQSGQFYMINVLENQWLSITIGFQIELGGDRPVTLSIGVHQGAHLRLLAIEGHTVVTLFIEGEMR